MEAFPISSTISLDDKYRVEHGVVLMAGRQALVRLPMLQRQLDRARGLNTAGFISGYRGSPLGGYDMELQRAARLLADHDIVFEPGLNEDIAATAVSGTQHLSFVPGRTVDGVFALWYGKGPGVDRSGDPFNHGNRAGVEPNGGVLLVFGDDHAGKSSTTAHQSDQAMAANEIPIFYPANVGEIIEYGLAGWALSRCSGLFVGLKVVNETAEMTETVRIDVDAYRFADAGLDADGSSVHIRKEFLSVMAQDMCLVRDKIPIVQRFVAVNRLDRIRWGAESPGFAIVAAGKAYGDVLSALALLDIDGSQATGLGIGVYKPALIYPLEPGGLRALAATAGELLFVEEKRAFMETQAAALLYGDAHRPRITGKHDPEGAALLPEDVLLEPLAVAVAIARRLLAGALPPDTASRLAARLAELDAAAAAANAPPSAAVARRPAFCAGCPHSNSTRVPPDSIGMAGIGCHGMVAFLPERNPLPLMHMGGEGASWIGLSRFTTTAHVFQNLGDGTYNHSGSLAVRAAVQAKVNITYKILYNDAVAMTGGQPVEGQPRVADIAAQLLAEGVRRVVVLSELPDRFVGAEALPGGVELKHRDALQSVQLGLREMPGVTAIIYDQMCAAEKRRRRKRGEHPDPDRRLFINPAVCEGCGDCSVQSECAAIQPLETELGRKRRIDQSACNKDFSCLKGFCPSFVTVEGGRLRRQPPVGHVTSVATQLPDPDLPAIGGGLSILATGIGGTGVVTITAILAMAAHLEGKGASVFDMTGLSQKGGAVYSHLRLGPQPGMDGAARIGPRQADLILGCDAVATTGAESIRSIAPGRTRVIVNRDVVAIADFNRRPDARFDLQSLLAPLNRAMAGCDPDLVAAEMLATTRLGNAIGTNMLMLGFAWQKGAIPLSRAAIHQAIELNGVAVRFNIDAFELGRSAALGREEVSPAAAETPAEADLDGFIRRRIADLTAYRDARYAERYRLLVAGAGAAEAALGLAGQ